MSGEATVFVIDDDPEALRSMRWLLESEDLAVETYASGEEFLGAYDARHPGCILLDLRMPEMDGVELQRRLRSQQGCAPIVFISGRGEVAKCAEAMKGGALDFLEKPVDDAKLLAVVRQALEEDRWRRSVEASNPEISARLARLTPRERETLRCLLKGDTMKQIAGRLDIGFQTVAKHRAHALGKMHVQNELELVRLLKDYPL